MDTSLVSFYHAMYKTIARYTMYRGENYLLPMEVAAFNLAVKDLRNNITRKDELEIIKHINDEYDSSPTIINLGDTGYVQSLVNDYGSEVMVKHTYTKIDFLSLLTSFYYTNHQIAFINSLLNLYYPNGHEVLEKIRFELNINKTRDSFCQNIKTKSQQ
ncbi:hypothetical protein KC929_01445 [Patescibacteria group bacterium]|nr:hypothetical protein [Patescibacteria group bacterium]